MNLTQFLLALNARKWVALTTLFLTVTTALVVSLLSPKTYTSTATLVVGAKGYDPVTGAMLPYQLTPKYIATQVDIINSPTVAVRVVKQLGLDKVPALRASFQKADHGKGSLDLYIAHRLLKKLSVDPSPTSNLVRISFKDRDPRFTSLVTNAFAKAYIQTDLDLTTQPAQQSTTWFRQQARHLRNRLEKAQNALSVYEQRHGLVSDRAAHLETARLADLSTQLVAAEAAGIDASPNTRNGAQSPEVLNSPVIAALTSRRDELDAQLADARKKLGPNNPEYQSLVAQRNMVETQLAITRRQTERGIAARLSSLQAAYTAQKAKVLQVQKERDEASILQQTIASAKQAYDKALQRMNQTMLEANSVQTDVAIVNKARPSVLPSSPRVFHNMEHALFLGALLGIGLVFLLEILDRRVRSAQDIELMLDIPVLNVALHKPRRLIGVRRLLIPLKGHNS